MYLIFYISLARIAINVVFFVVIPWDSSFCFIVGDFIVFIWWIWVVVIGIFIRDKGGGLLWGLVVVFVCLCMLFIIFSWFIFVTGSVEHVFAILPNSAQAPYPQSPTPPTCQSPPQPYSSPHPPSSPTFPYLSLVPLTNTPNIILISNTYQFYTVHIILLHIILGHLLILVIIVYLFFILSIFVIRLMMWMWIGWICGIVRIGIYGILLSTVSVAFFRGVFQLRLANFAVLIYWHFAEYKSP